MAYLQAQTGEATGIVTWIFELDKQNEQIAENKVDSAYGVKAN